MSRKFKIVDMIWSSILVHMVEKHELLYFVIKMLTRVKYNKANWKRKDKTYENCYRNYSWYSSSFFCCCNVLCVSSCRSEWWKVTLKINNKGGGDMIWKKQICPRCKTGKDSYELDKRSEACPYIGCWKNCICSFYDPLEKPKKENHLWDLTRMH